MFGVALDRMISGWRSYAEAHKAAYDEPIASDGVIGAAWRDMGVSIRDMLAGELGSQDGATLSRRIGDAFELGGFDREGLDRIAERTDAAGNRAPCKGMAATIRVGTDCHAATVIAVSTNGRVISVQRDKATRTDRNGQSEEQSYTYTRDPVGEIERFYRRTDGSYRQRSGVRLTLGERREYCDPSF